MVGEIVDFSCYLQIGKHGEKHRSCAQKCFTAGQPIGLLTKDGSLYMLMEEEHDPRRDGLTNFRQAAMCSQIRPRFNFDTPSLIIGEVHMKAIHFVIGQ